MSASSIVQFFLILALFFTSIGGIVVASVLKEMDNVVKVRNKMKVSSFVTSAEIRFYGLS